MAMFWSYDVIVLHRPVTGHTENMVTMALGFHQVSVKAMVISGSLTVLTAKLIPAEIWIIQIQRFPHVS
jgi:hypothetical protein